MNRVRFAITAVGFVLCSAVSLAQLTGNVTTVNESGTAQDVFSSKSDVFFTAGPTATPCAFTQFISDGRYYFQVTDLTGAHLLSTDPLAERIVTVRNGVLATYDGHTHRVDTVEGMPHGLAMLDEQLSRSADVTTCLLYTSPSPRDRQKSRMPSSA